MKEIAETGYWNGETAHHHHVHSKELSDWIVNFLKERDQLTTYISDFGCGLGNYLKDLKEAGFNRLIGFEGDIPVNKVFDNIYKQDLTKPFLSALGNVISLEVGEHIDAKYMDTYLENIQAACSDYLITSWAVRGQGGFGHVNELDNHEIIPHFEKRGFKLLEKETQEARSVIQDNAWWFRNTILIFKKI